MAQEYHCEDIKLLLVAITKHFLQHAEYLFQEINLELRACLSKTLKKPLGLICKKAQQVLQKWDDRMTLMTWRIHLYGKVHTTEDLSDLIPKGIGSYPQTSQAKGKGNGSGRAPKTSTKPTFTTKSTTEQEIQSQQQWESTTGISISPGQKKLQKQLKRMKIEAPENLDSSERKQTNL